MRVFCIFSLFFKFGCILGAFLVFYIEKEPQPIAGALFRLGIMF